MNAARKAAITRRENRLTKQLGKILADKGLWDPTLSPEDQKRNERFVARIREAIVSLRAQRDELNLAES